VSIHDTRVTEVREVRDDDRDRLEDIQLLLEQRDRDQGVAANAALAMQLALDHQGRIAALEEARVALQREDVHVRVETNSALRDMSEKLGRAYEVTRAQRATQWLIAIAIVVMAGLQVLDRFGAR
jgi:hypothetical protein